MSFWKKFLYGEKGEIAQEKAIEANESFIEYIRKVAQEVNLGKAERARGRLLSGQYKLLCELGSGGFGTVYKARDVHLDQFVAIRELALENPERLKHEAKVLSELRHKNIVGFRQLFPDDECWYIVMDYVDGGNLGRLISGRPFYHGGGENALMRILLIAQQTAEGLGCAHQHGIIHQGVKPANVMVDLRGVAKVSDFGLAAQSLGAGSLDLDPISRAMDGQASAYYSPEQASRHKLTNKTDTWSWALTVLQMFTGEITWQTGLEARRALYRCEGKRTRQEIPPLPQQLVNLLERCFQDDPQARPDMRAIVTTLADI